MGVSFGNSGDISWKISTLNFCKKVCTGQRNQIRLAYDAFSVAKVSYDVAQKISFGKSADIPLEYEAPNFCKKDGYLNRRM